MTRKTLLTSLLLIFALTAGGSAEDTKKILLLGTKRDHPPGTHEYMAGLDVLAKCLNDIPGLDVSIHKADEPWPEGPELLKEADGIVMSLGEGSRWEQLDPERYRALRALADRGGAIVGLHWAIGGKDGKYIPGHLALMGGCHGGEDRKYIFTEADLNVALPRHPITAGIDDLRLKDEFYYRLKFATTGTVTPVMQAVIDGQPETVAWAFERPDGGRSFGFSGMHYHDNWSIESLRRLIVQGLLWTLDRPIPEKGLPVPVTEDDLKLD